MNPLMLLTMSLVAVTTAFQIRPQGRTVSFGVALKAMVDDAKIKDAAEHFGKYSLEEIQEMKEELHKERVQSLIFDRDNVINSEMATEQRLLEQELELQLALLQKDLKEASPASKLFPEDTLNKFPEVEEPMVELPHLKDGTLSAKGVQEKKLFIMEEAFFEENVLETIAFCSILAVLMMAPQLIA